MSATSWMQEFYSNPDPNLKVLTKWIGLSKKNIAKHSGEKLGHIVRFDSFIFRANFESCYFCQDTKNKNKLIACENCVGFIKTSEKCEYGWRKWLYYSFNIPMIEWVIKVLLKMEYDKKEIFLLYSKYENDFLDRIKLLLAITNTRGEL